MNLREEDQYEWRLVTNGEDLQQCQLWQEGLACGRRKEHGLCSQITWVEIPVLSLTS